MEEREGWLIPPPGEGGPSAPAPTPGRAPEGRGRRRALIWAAVIGGGLVLLGLLLAGAAFVASLAVAKEGPVFGPSIGVVDITGVIAGESGAGLFGGMTGARAITRQLRRAMEEDDIKAVVLRINSPGGTAAASQQIYQAVMRLRRKGKTVVAYLGDVATSGAYYVASAADVIVASPATLTGSIGVIMELVDISGLMRKLGVRAYTLKSGKFKDIGSLYRPPTPEERALLKALVMDVYNQFVRDVAKGRGLSVERVRAIADGRILTGRMAKSYGLVDVLGTYDDAVRIAARRAGIKGKPRVVRLAPRRLSLLDLLLSSGEWDRSAGPILSFLMTPVKLLPPVFAR